MIFVMNTVQIPCVCMKCFRAIGTSKTMEYSRYYRSLWFLEKLWRLYFDDNGLNITNDEPTADMFKSLHKTIKKVTEDIENFSFNTSVSQFMICVNELSQQNAIIVLF